MEYSEYFLKFTGDLAYLDLKEEAPRPAFIPKGLPLPIRTFDFLEGLKEDRLEESIAFSYFLKGMVWNLGVDPDFKYGEDYKKILKAALKEPDRLACDLAMEGLKGGNPDHGRIGFRAALVINPENLFAKNHLAGLLFSYAEKNLTGGDQEAFMKKASSLYEEVLEEEEENLLANAGLGRLNAALGHYLKAQAYYQRALSGAPREEIREEIRSAKDEIRPQAAIEDGLYYLNRADYDKAIHAFNQAKKDQNRYDVHYYLGTAFQNVGAYEKAWKSFQEALDKGGDFEDIYNGLVYNLNADGRPDLAIEYASLGLKRHPSALMLRFNRAVLYGTFGEKKKALEDFDYLLGYGDLSDEFFSQVMTAKEELLGGGEA